MKFHLIQLFYVLATLGIGVAEPSLQPENSDSRLDFFLPNEQTKQSIGALIDELDSEIYVRRDAASHKLTSLPTLPGFVRQLEKEEKRPEVRARIKDLIRLFPIERENNELNSILKQIRAKKTKGLLGKITTIIKMEIWSPDSYHLHQAAFATVTAEDLPLIKSELNNGSIHVRSLMAAALGGLQPKVSSQYLTRLLADESDRVCMSAAISLAKQKQKTCLPPLARLLDSPDFQTRYQSWSTLRSLSGKAFGYAPDDAEGKRKSASKKWRKWASGPTARLIGPLPTTFDILPFNGKDLTGWEVYENGQLAPQQTSWSVKEGQLMCLGVNRGEIRTARRFENYILTLDYKVEQNNGDGGVGVMLTKENEKLAPAGRGGLGRYLEVQVLPGKTGDLYSIGNFKAVANGKALNFSSPRTADVDDPPGKWHKLKLTVKDGELKVEINGVLVNQATQGSKGAGKIVIRNEGSKIAYKNMKLRPLQLKP